MSMPNLARDARTSRGGSSFSLGGSTGLARTALASRPNDDREQRESIGENAIRDQPVWIAWASIAVVQAFVRALIRGRTFQHRVEAKIPYLRLRSSRFAALGDSIWIAPLATVWA